MRKYFPSMIIVEQEMFTLPEHLRSPPNFWWGSCYRIFRVLRVCIVDRCLSFRLFYFVCPTSIYELWLWLWYFQTLLPTLQEKGLCNHRVNTSTDAGSIHLLVDYSLPMVYHPPRCFCRIIIECLFYFTLQIDIVFYWKMNTSWAGTANPFRGTWVHPRTLEKIV
jgi:hypothetical protein